MAPVEVTAPGAYAGARVAWAGSTAERIELVSTCKVFAGGSDIPAWTTVANADRVFVDPPTADLFAATLVLVVDDYTVHDCAAVTCPAASGGFPDGAYALELQMRWEVRAPMN